MRISARCDYACKALLELSLHWPSKEPMSINTISHKQNIPMRYLVQILIQLKRIGMVHSLRGKSGGYLLAKHPVSVRLGEVIRNVQGPFVQVAKKDRKNRIFLSIWDEVDAAVSEVVDRISFEDIVNRSKSGDKTLSYSI